MACDKQPSFGSLLEQLIVASYAMRIDLGKRVLERVEAQVAELTRERDEARYEHRTAVRDAATFARDATTAESEVTRLTEALAAAERRSVFNAGKCGEEYTRAEAAEARVRELEAELARVNQ